MSDVSRYPRMPKVARNSIEAFRRTADSINYLLQRLNTFIDMMTVLSTTTTALADVTSDVNTTNKYAGRTLFNTTTNSPVWAAGPLATDVWRTVTGHHGSDITPV